MPQVNYIVPSIRTLQELDRAVERYKTSNLSGGELLSLWQAIRDASLNQSFSEPKNDGVSVENSY
ncbi:MULTISPECIES: hypothetical protein [Aerosakkonema]|uniref:hypothetical protein n=1 Tax=Aerosakkonema TaxID=1246629 RepID=UPI0035B96AE0